MSSESKVTELERSMTVNELVRHWHGYFDSPEPSELILGEMTVLEFKIKERTECEGGTRVFAISETECVVSFWIEDNHYLDVCEMEGI